MDTSKNEPNTTITALMESVDPKDVIKIMVATDNHLGYLEKDSIRGEDSFIAFEEILELAEYHEVDFILHGGDLFHDSAPTQNTLNRCMRLLRKTTLGDRPISLEFLSDQSVNFADSLNQTVNYEDPNMNVSIPVFGIHGNHDDPSGFGRLSSLDLLSTSGLINYFGKWTDLTAITINPILLRKGETQLALYGLSHIHDARLARLFRDSKVVVEKPPESTGEWFNLMVLHQNRADRGPTNYLPEDILPSFLDLIIWGHEHDCRINPEENLKNQFFVSQPGSSVATSLSEGESTKKHCALLYIQKKQFFLHKIPLKTVRPFVFESISLADYIEDFKLDEGNTEKKVIDIAKDKIEQLIERSMELKSDDPRQPKLPLIRLRILFTDESQMFNTIKFGQKYAERVANPSEMILFNRQTKKLKSEKNQFDEKAMNAAYEENITDACKVEDVVKRYFEEIDVTKKLKLLSSNILGEMCYRISSRNDTNAAESILTFYEEKVLDHLMEKLPNEENLNLELSNFCDKTQDNYEYILNKLDNLGNIRKTDINDDHIDFVLNDSPKKPATRGRGRGSRGGRGKSTNSGAAGPSRPELNVSVSSRSQSSIKDSFTAIADRASGTRSSKRQSKPIIYEIDSD